MGAFQTCLPSFRGNIFRRIIYVFCRLNFPGRKESFFLKSRSIYPLGDVIPTGVRRGPGNFGAGLMVIAMKVLPFMMCVNECIFPSEPVKWRGLGTLLLPWSGNHDDPGSFADNYQRWKPLKERSAKAGLRDPATNNAWDYVGIQTKDSRGAIEEEAF